MATKRRNQLGLMVTGVMCAVSLILLAGCADDLYAPCTLDPSSPDPAIQLCGDRSQDLSCAVDNYVQCDTRVCARFSGSEPFCTKRCTDDGASNSHFSLRKNIVSKMLSWISDSGSLTMGWGSGNFGPLILMNVYQRYEGPRARLAERVANSTPAFPIYPT
jgi:hypothetical protein